VKILDIAIRSRIESARSVVVAAGDRETVTRNDAHRALAVDSSACF